MLRISIEKPKCRNHCAYSEYVCFDYKCILGINLCQKCFEVHQNHEKDLIKITDMVNNIKSIIDRQINDKFYLENKKNQLNNLLVNYKNEIKKKETNNLNILLLKIQKQQKRKQQIIRSIIFQKSILKSIIKIYNYFNNLIKSQLLTIKLKISSQKGLKRFKEKIKKFLYNVYQQKDYLQKIFKSYQKNINQYQQFYKNSLTSQIDNLTKAQLQLRSTLKQTRQTANSEAKKSGKVQQGII